MPYKRSESARSNSKTSFRETKEDEEETDPNFQPCESINMNKIIGSKGLGSQQVSRRNSQSDFASQSQTIQIFDWDDTLFPTTWVRHYMGLHWKYPLDQQEGITPVQKRKIKTALEDLQDEVEGMINLAFTKGHVVIVTLAKHPWVALSCENFFPKIKKLLNDKNVTIVYAQELNFAHAELPPPNPEDPESQEQYWVKKKQLAIESEVRKFYTQYPGQSWKNVISIGDSDFERRATYETMMGYKADQGNSAAQLDLSRSKGEDVMCLSGMVGNHYRRLRTKTVKMYDSPRIKDLQLELQLLKKWLPSLVNLDSGLDVDLEDDERLADTHRLLTGEVL